MTRILKGLLPALICTTAFGCASQRPVAYQPDIERARMELASGHTGAAARTIEQVKANQSLSQGERAVLALLEAEFRLAIGEAREALLIVEGISDPRLVGQVNEIAGKALIKSGRYAQASERLVAARSAYSRPGDLARVENLLLVAEGLESYSAGRGDEARRLWSGIEDAQLKRSLESSLQRRGVRVALDQ